MARLYPPPPIYPPSQCSSGSSSCELVPSEEPVLFRPRGSSKLKLSVEQSSWSPPFSASAVETAGLVVCRDKERHTRYRSVDGEGGGVNSVQVSGMGGGGELGTGQRMRGRTRYRSVSLLEVQMVNS